MNRLFLWNITLAKLHPTTFRDFLLGFESLGLVWMPALNSRDHKAFDPGQITDQVLRECGRKGIELGVTLCDGVYDGSSILCAATDAGVLE